MAKPALTDPHGPTAAPGRPGAAAAGSPLGNAASARAGAAPGAGPTAGLGNAAAARAAGAPGGAAGAPGAGAPSPLRHVAQPLDETVRAAREQRAAEAIRRREERELARRDRPLEAPFKWESPLGDPDHVVELKGHPRLDLEPIQVLQIQLSDDPVSIPVRFAHLAWGTVQVAGSFDGLQTFHTPHPRVIALDHPGLPSLDEASVPALLVEVRGGVVSGEIVTVSEANQASMRRPGPGFRPIDTANLPRVMALEDLQNLRIGAVENKLRDGHLTFHVRDMAYDLHGVFPGHGHFDLDDERHHLTADAHVEAKGVKKQTVAVGRDDLGQIRARSDSLSVELSTPEGQKLAGTLHARFGRGVFDIRGTVSYSGGDVANGQVTVLITDEAAAWASVRQRLGDQAPPVAESTGAPHGLAFVGWGELEFKVNEWLTGTGEVVLDPDGYVTVLGQLRPTKVLTLFPVKATEPKDLIKPERRKVIVPVYGVPVELAATLTLRAHASAGPATLSDIAVDGLFTTRPHQPTEFRISGTFAFPASAAVDLGAMGSVSLPSILRHLGSLEAGLEGKAVLNAQALARPHIGRRRHGTDPSKASYYLGGRLQAAAELNLGLDGGVYINPPVFSRWSLISFSSKRWRVGLGSISVEGTYVLGEENNKPRVRYTVGKDTPEVATGPIWTAMTGRSAAGIEEGQVAPEEGRAHWTDAVDVTSEPRAKSVTPPGGLPPVAVPVPTAAQAELPAYRGTAMPPLTEPSPTASAGQAPALPPSTAPPAPAPATSTPAAAGQAADPSLPPIVETFSMLDTPHQLSLVRAHPPFILIASPVGDRLRAELGIAMRVLDAELNRALHGPSADVDRANRVADELEYVEGILKACKDVEARGFTEAFHPPGHVTGFAELAEQLSAYASLFGRRDLLRKIGSLPGKVLPPPPGQTVRGHRGAFEVLAEKDASAALRLQEDYERYRRLFASRRRRGRRATTPMSQADYLEMRARFLQGQRAERPSLALYNAETGLNVQKNEQKILLSQPHDPAWPRRIPDVFVEGLVIADFKNVSKLTFTDQLKDFAAIADLGPGTFAYVGPPQRPVGRKTPRFDLIVRALWHERGYTDTKEVEGKITGDVYELIEDPNEPEDREH
jgi:hypothetical protein